MVDVDIPEAESIVLKSFAPARSDCRPALKRILRALDTLECAPRSGRA
jgi:hypothetical protein